MIRSKTIVATAMLCATPAFAGDWDNQLTYGWEDGGTILGYFNSGSGEITATNSSEQVFAESSALQLVEDPTGGTPQVWVGFVTGLQDGDIISANFMVYDDTEGGSPSVRIWGGYAMSDDISNYMGSAGGNSDYSAGTGWSNLSHQWTFDSGLGGSNEGRDGLVIQVRMYSDSDSSPVYIDNLNIQTSSSTAVINVAPAPGALALLGLAGLAGRRRRA